MLGRSAGGGGIRRVKAAYCSRQNRALTPRCLIHDFLADRRSSIWRVWAAPCGRETFQKGGGRSPPTFLEGFPAARGRPDNKTRQESSTGTHPQKKNRRQDGGEDDLTQLQINTLPHYVPAALFRSIYKAGLGADVCRPQSAASAPAASRAPRRLPSGQQPGSVRCRPGRTDQRKSFPLRANKTDESNQILTTTVTQRKLGHTRKTNLL